MVKIALGVAPNGNLVPIALSELGALSPVSGGSGYDENSGSFKGDSFVLIGIAPNGRPVPIAVNADGTIQGVGGGSDPAQYDDVLDMLGAYQDNGNSFGTLYKEVVVTDAQIKALLSPQAVAAQSTLRYSTLEELGTAFTIGSTTYTFVAVAAVPGDVTLAGNVTASRANVAAAIRGTDGINSANAEVTAPVSFTGSTLVLTARAPGVVGNSIAISSTGAELTFDDFVFGDTTRAGVDATRAPLTLIAAPGADLVLTVLSVRSLLDAQSGAYTNDGGNPYLVAGFGNLAEIGNDDTVVGIVQVGAARGDWVSTSWVRAGYGDIAFEDRVNQPFTLVNIGQLNFAGGHASNQLLFQIQYRIDPAVIV